jgi:uncharacterized protein (DUF433 family)
MTEQADYFVGTAYISQRPGYCGGEPCIHGRRIKVRHVYVWHDVMGMTPEEIAEAYNLSLAQIHAALSYAYDHLDEIKAAIQAEDEFVERLKQENPDSVIPYEPNPDEDPLLSG